MLNPNLPARRVFIVGNNLLFEEGMAHLLTLGTGLDVSNIKYINDLAFLDMIGQGQPDVIVLNESTFIDSVHILELFSSIQLLLSLCIIIVRLGNNMVDVYKLPKNQISKGNIHERRQFTVTKRDDLIAIVHGEFTKDL